MSLWGIITSIGVVLTGLGLGSVMFYRNDFEEIFLIVGFVCIIGAIPVSILYDSKKQKQKPKS